MGEGSGLELITSGLDDFEFEIERRESGPALGQNHICLGQGQGAAPGGNEDGFVGFQAELFGNAKPVSPRRSGAVGRIEGTGPGG